MSSSKPRPEAALPSRIVLVGMMGSGKSTAAAALAHALGWDCVDMDRHLEEEAGLPVREIFARLGEPAFRERERALAESLRGRHRVVVAAGGGAFVREDTRRALSEGAVTVWLRCDAQTLLGRVSLDGSRPLAVSRERILDLFAEREPSYRLADLCVDASQQPDVVVRQIEEALHSGTSPGTP